MVSTATVLSLNWIHSKIICGATFRIIGLTKIPKIEFVPLDWIYHSIRINTIITIVIHSHLSHTHMMHYLYNLS